MSRPRIAIAHQTIWIGDAIGNDIAGAYELLASCGYEMTLLCENAHPALPGRYRVISGPAFAAAAADFDLLIFHHSVHWEGGERLLRDFRGPVVVKYHNITPPEFFAPYTARYRDVCQNGRMQSARMAAMDNIVRWQSDSPFNSAEIEALGVSPERLAVVPPFNHIDRSFRAVRAADYPRAGPFHALFVGRRVPNKGHVHLLRTLAAWRELFPAAELHCRIVGATDPEVDAYYRELHALERRLGVTDRVQWIGHVTAADLEGYFATSHLYLNLSEHEGFCVPVIEAQAMALPLITTNATALRDTVGFEQIAVPVPRAQEDYDVIAGLAYEICTSAELRRVLVDAGCRNAFRRFTARQLESGFLGDLEPVLATLEP